MGRRHRHRRVAHRGGQDLGRPTPTAWRPSPTAIRQPTSERTMLWQKASARTVATASAGRVTAPTRGRAGCGSWWLPPRRRQNAAKSCCPEQPRGRGVHRVQVEQPRPGQHVAPRQRVDDVRGVGDPVGVAAPQRPRTGRRSPRPPRGHRAPGRRARQHAVERARSSGPSYRRVPLRLDVEVRHLPARVHAGVGASGADHGTTASRSTVASASRAPPARCAAPAGSPTRGSLCRRRPGRSGAAPAHPTDQARLRPVA